jgi:hypothetical protein
MRILGADFSGDHEKWEPGCTVSNVWIAELDASADRTHLARLDRVQTRYAGAVRPFAALAAELRGGRFACAAIDAPFSVPARHVPGKRHAALLALVDSISDGIRDFPTGASLLAALADATSPTVCAKPLRATETHWVDVGVATRSTLWAGARGGAPMTAACLRLLARAARPMWPWSAGEDGLLVEAFPAAQLLTWRLPRTRYDGSHREVGAANRRTIVAYLRRRLDVAAHEAKLLGSADAIDAVLCALAALAVARRRRPRTIRPDGGARGVDRGPPMTPTSVGHAPGAWNLIRADARNVIRPAARPLRLLRCLPHRSRVALRLVCHSLPHPETLPRRRDEPRVMREPVEQRGRELLVAAEDLHPFSEGQVRRDDHAVSLVPVGLYCEGPQYPCPLVGMSVPTS